jgi:hypothetical protein
MSPTQRTRKSLKDAGIHSYIVEHFNVYSQVRQDLFGFCDIVALGPKIRAIQCTTQSNFDARFKKIIANEDARKWVELGGAVELYAWGLYGARGKRKTWQARIHMFNIDDFKNDDRSMQGAPTNP